LFGAQLALGICRPVACAVLEIFDFGLSSQGDRTVHHAVLRLDGNTKARTKHAQLFVVQLFFCWWVCSCFTGSPNIAFDCFARMTVVRLVIEGGAIGALL